MNFEFATANRIIFGASQIKLLPEIARSYGTSALVVVGKQSERTESIRQMLGARGVGVTAFNVASEPTLEMVTEGLAQLRLANCDLVIAIGGGSVIDAGKAIAALATNRRPVLDYLEVIWAGEPLQERPLPMIAIPTTAGSGAEVTRNAVLTSTEHKIKVSLRHAWMLPTIALLDPDLTVNLPPHVTAATGIDAMVHAIEAYTSTSAYNNPVSQALAKEALRLLGRNIERAVHHGHDIEARSAMLLGSMLAGQAFANSPVAAVHALAYPIGGHFGIPHGLSNALVLPHVLRFNAPVAADLYAELAPHVFPHLAGLSGAPCADAFVEAMAALAVEIGLQPRLRDVGNPADALAMMAEDAMKQTRLLVNNPRPVTLADARAIYEAAW